MRTISLTPSITTEHVDNGDRVKQTEMSISTTTTATQRAAVVVVVPKDDEFRETRRAFGVSAEQLSALPVGDGEEYFTVEIGESRVVVACLDGQGNDKSQSFATRLINRFHPSFICVTGTALGNPAYSSMGAVFASHRVLGLTQIRQTEHGQIYQDAVSTEAAKAVLRDLRDHLSDSEQLTSIRTLIGSRASALGLDIDVGKYTVDAEMIGSGNEYFTSTSERVQSHLWEPYPYMCAYDMESWGVVQAAERDGVDWMTFRGVSDFGIDGGMKQEQRQLAAYASAVALRSFLASPRVRMRERDVARRVDKDELPPENFYVQNSRSVISFKERIGRDLGIELGDDVLDRALTPSDLVEVIVKAGGDRESASVLLPVVHEEYFRDKYLNYHYRDAESGKAVDSRALSRDWAKSIRDYLAEFGLNTLFGKSVIDVGCGNGEELQALFPDASVASSIILVDLAREFLELARRRFPTGSVRGVRATAAELIDVPDDSVDLYISLRTYQSRMFDIDGAFREAYRITRTGGLIAISISNGYAAEVRDRDGLMREVVVPGLKASGLDRSVSQSAPRALAERLQRLFARFGMSARQVDLRHGEILVCGHVGDFYAADYFGA